uniref:Uncharacterized protein n=1 Tax=Arundo donax TaxID=35708 RepID=A0A0A9QDW3_ARUDO
MLTATANGLWIDGFDVASNIALPCSRFGYHAIMMMLP